jgi:hypothetical protein
MSKSDTSALELPARTTWCVTFSPTAGNPVHLPPCRGPGPKAKQTENKNKFGSRLMVRVGNVHWI